MASHQKKLFLSFRSVPRNKRPRQKILILSVDMAESKKRKFFEVDENEDDAVKANYGALV